MSSAHMADPTIEMWNDLERQVLEALARWRARESECEQLVATFRGTLNVHQRLQWYHVCAAQIEAQTAFEDVLLAALR